MPNGEIEIGDHRVERRSRAIAQATLCAIVEAPTPPLAPIDRDDAADRLGVRRREQPADRAHDVERADRRDQIVADAAAGELAIEQNVVDAADHDHARAGVADLGELIEAAEDVVAAALGLDDDDVRRRRAAIGFDGGGDAAHLDLEMRLGQPAILAGGLHGGGGLDGLAKRLHRNARRRRDVLVVRRRRRGAALRRRSTCGFRSFADVADLAFVVIGI